MSALNIGSDGSTGNEGVEQLVGRIFSKCGMAILFLPIVAALFLMAGCLEKSPGFLKDIPEAQTKQADVYPSSLQMDFDSDVSSSLFRVRGDLTPFGNGSFPYLLLRASLQKDGVEVKSAKYLMIDVKPGGDHGFEISKNMKILPGNYNCTLEISGPTGTLACETRGCKVAGPWTEPSSAALAGVSGEGRPIGVVDERSRSPQEERNRRKVDVGEEEETPKNEDGAGKSLSRVEEEAARTEDQVSGSPGSSSPESRSEVSGFQVPEERSVSSDYSASSARKVSGTDAEKKYDGTSAGTKFVGSSSSKKYHRPDCRYALKIKADKRIFFSSEEDAKSQGYLPCKVCNP